MRTWRRRRSSRSRRKFKLMQFIYLGFFAFFLYCAWDAFYLAAASTVIKAKCSGNAKCMAQAQSMVERKFRK